MKTFLRQYSKPVVSILLVLVLMASTLVTGVIATGEYKETVNKNNTEATAVSAAESKTTSVEPDADNSTDKAVKNTAGSSINKKKDKKRTGATAKNRTGYNSTGYVKGSWDSWATPDDSKGHNMTSGYTVSLAANTTYEFVCLADNGDVFKKDTTITADIDDYDFLHDATANAKIKTTVAGDYTFKFKSWNSSNCMRIKITYPSSATTTTWTAVGAYGENSSSDPGFFGAAWAPTATANDMTESSGVWTKTWSNVTLNENTTVYYKVAKNHAWTTSYPSENGTETISAGTYNITMTYNESNNSVSLEATSVAKSTLSVQNNIDNAIVTATYNGTTVNEGSSISDIPQGATVTINVTPDNGYKCTAVTGTYNTSSTENASSDSTGKVWTMTMPGANTEVSATISTVSLKKIYFNNNYTQYGTVYAYVYDKDSSDNETNLYLGKKPGKVMIESENSEIWYIEVPENITYVQFISGDGSTTGEMTIPWKSGSTGYDYPKYTAPYGYNSEPTEAHGGTWGNYLYGSDNKRTNEYTVTDGSTMSASNLFTGISATLYDYYTDGEITASAGTASDTGASGAPNGWIKGIAKDEYCRTDNGWKWNPYTTLNSALSAYADNSVQPKYDVSKPLYFGNLNVSSRNSTDTDYAINTTGNGNINDILAYHGWDSIANNSIDLDSPNNAVTGLSGKTLGDDETIHYYSNSDATNENGAPMAMFNEDFLSGENSQNKALATILRTSSFPVRKTVEGATPETKTVYLENSSDGSFNHTSQVWCHTWNSSNNAETYDTFGNYNSSTQTWSFSGIPSSYDKIQFVKSDSNTDMNYNGGKLNDGVSFDNNNNTYSCSLVTNNIYLDLNGNDWWTNDSAVITAHLWNANGAIDRALTKISTGKYYCDATGYTNVIFYRKVGNNWYNKTSNLNVYKGRTYKLDTGWDTESDYYNWSWTGSAVATTPGTAGHTYYEFDSTNGKDNAYITDISKTNKTAKINYYTDKKVKSSNNTYGFFPFDYNTYQSNLENTAHDLGFGMKLEILFNLNDDGLNTDGTHQTFDFSGDDDLWVFIDGKLALDLGGAHGRTTGSIDFKTMTITATNTQAIGSATRNGSISSIVDTSAADFNPNYVHTMTIYYMERGMFDSNLKFGFSFHAIPNMFWVDKKIRTKDKYNLGYDTINAGFFTDNGKSGDASNMTTHTVGGKTTTMSKFEKSFQDEEFKVEQKVNHNDAGFELIADSLGYTIDNDSNTYNPLNGRYQIKHDLGNCFVGQFAKGDVFNLKEIIGNNNKYVYQPVFSVVDQANNDKTVTHTGDNSDGYEFTFTPTTTVTGGIDMLNLKARFDNYMVAHDLTLTKEITNAADTSTNFTFKILFDFTGTEQSPNYVAYPLYCDVDGVRQQLDNDGKITVKAGQKVVIIAIPEKAKIKVQEVLTDTITSYRYGGITLTKGGSTVNPTSTDNSTKSIVFTMDDADMSAVVSNSKPIYNYLLKYTYPAYVSDYGNQSYTVSGVFTEDEMTTYLQLNGSLQPEFKNDSLKRTFVNIKAPYEDNFQQTLSFASSDISDTGEGKGWSSGTYSCEVTAEAKYDNKINAYFNLPYAVDASLVPQESDSSGKVAMITAASQGSKDIDCFDWYVTSGKSKHDKTGGSPVFVKAPLILYTTTTTTLDTPHYFQYWKVMSQSGYGRDSTEITRCYDYEFNFALFMDCIIEPVYESTWAQTDNNPNPPTTYNMYERFDPEVQITNDSNSSKISIAFLENSRNQYNNGDKGTRKGNAAADLIYTDFLLNFNYIAGTTKLNELAVGAKKAGIVIEAVNYMDYEGDTTIFDYDKDYSKESAFTSNVGTQKTAITNWLTSGGANPTGIAKSEFDVSKNGANANKPHLDNKNCIQYYYKLSNRRFSSAGGAQLLNNMQNRYKVFRAYAYIGNVSGANLSNVTLSDPVYFTIYDAGSKGLDDNANKP